MTSQIPDHQIESIKTMRLAGMNVREVAARVGVSRETVSKYSPIVGSPKRVGGHFPKIFERYTATRTLPNGTRRSVTADSQERADAVCNWQKLGHVTAEIVAEVERKHLGTKAEHGTKRNGPRGVGSTCPGLTETDLSQEVE